VSQFWAVLIIEVVLAVGPGLLGAGEYQVRALSFDEVVVLAALE
jgi:hypothetical protein